MFDSMIEIIFFFFFFFFSSSHKYNIIMTPIEEPIYVLPGFDHVQDREQEVKPHIGAVTYAGLNLPILLAQDLSGGCGGKIWECASIMIEYMIWKNQQLEGTFFQQQKLVEIGSGTGLVGLAVARICPEIKELILTDQL
jgi:hypothetical protein